MKYCGSHHGRPQGKAGLGGREGGDMNEPDLSEDTAPRRGLQEPAGGIQHALDCRADERGFSQNYELEAIAGDQRDVFADGALGIHHVCNG